MAKPLQYCKVISLQLIKINEKMCKNIQLHIDCNNKKMEIALKDIKKNGLVTQLNTVQIKIITLEKCTS